jgi:Zn-dependent membrane protease YugP
MFFDTDYNVFVMLPGLLLSLWASFKVKTTFQRYSQIRPRSGLSGAEAARELLRINHVQGVSVEPIEGFLSDHYDPGARVLRLSPDVYHGRSLSALGVAAHEAGHALQHAANYAPLSFRSLVVKPAMFGSNLGMYVAFAGMAFHMTGMIWLGIILFSAFVLFTLVTLPVELDASKRAVAVLERSGMITSHEVEGTRKVLTAAALTYVAAAIGAVLQLVYLLWRAGILGQQRHEE